MGISYFKRAESVDLDESFQDLSEAVVDRDNGILRNVLLCGKISRNGREYSESALKSAAKLYVDRPVNVDHSRDERRMYENWGKVSRAEFTDDGIRGDVEYLKSHPDTESILERADRRFPMGFSHHARGQQIKKDDRQVVEKIEKVFSVDIVLNPATTTTIHESENQTMKIGDLLEKCKSITDCWEATVLREMAEEDPALAEEPVEAPAEEAPSEDPAAEIKAGLMKAVIAKLEKADGPTLKKVLRALGVPTDVTAGMGDDKPADESAENDESAEGEGEDEEKSESINIVQTMKDLVEQVRLENAPLKALAERGLTPSIVGRERYQSLKDAGSVAKIEEIIESWPEYLKGTPAPSVTRKNSEGSEKHVPLKQARRRR